MRYTFAANIRKVSIIANVSPAVDNTCVTAFIVTLSNYMFHCIDIGINLLPVMGRWKVKLLITCHQIYETGI